MLKAKREPVSFYHLFSWTVLTIPVEVKRAVETAKFDSDMELEMQHLFATVCIIPPWKLWLILFIV